MTRILGTSLVLSLVVGCSANSTLMGRPTGRVQHDAGVGEAGSGGDLSDPGDGAVSPDAGAVEICDGYDNNGDGQVDEGCSCSIGDTQQCFPGRPGEVLPCQAGTQTCTGSGSEFGSWGPCDATANLCEGATLTLDDSRLFRVIGAAANDDFGTLGGAALGDVNGDGELDFAAASQRGDGTAVDTGAGYAVFGGACLQGTTIDLSSAPLDGTDGICVDPVNARNRPSVAVGDFNGDGIADIAGADSAHTIGLFLGSTTPAALSSVSGLDGAHGTHLTGGQGSYGEMGIVTTDFNADGYADAFVGFENSSTSGSLTTAFTEWLGRPTFGASTSADFTMRISATAVGQSSLENDCTMGGAGDFNNDGYLDITAADGASNDTFTTMARVSVFYGGPDGTLPSSMSGVDGTSGFRTSGGRGRGAHASVQQGDFNGDGIDDLLLFGADNGNVYVIYGPTNALGATVDLSGLPTSPMGFVIESEGTLYPAGTRGALSEHNGNLASGVVGIGDIDGDGFDDLVVGQTASAGGGVYIIWGRANLTGDFHMADLTDVTELTGIGDGSQPSEVAVGDVDGDGLGDVLIGMSRATTANGSESGQVLVRFGRCLATGHDPDLVRGNIAANDLHGTSAADRIVGDRGDDRIDGGGGADVLSGGEGDETDHGRRRHLPARRRRAGQRYPGARRRRHDARPHDGGAAARHRHRALRHDGGCRPDPEGRPGGSRGHGQRRSPLHRGRKRRRHGRPHGAVHRCRRGDRWLPPVHARRDHRVGSPRRGRRCPALSPGKPASGAVTRRAPFGGQRTGPSPVGGRRRPKRSGVPIGSRPCYEWSRSPYGSLRPFTSSSGRPGHRSDDHRRCRGE